MGAVLLTVGLWPFNFRPPNHVNWLKDRVGLSFQPDGIAYDRKPLIGLEAARQTNRRRSQWSFGSNRATCPPPIYLTS